MSAQLTVEAGNKIIAEFMGTFKSCDFYGKDSVFINGAPKRHKIDEIRKVKYHSSWDWLMTACHKWDCLTDAEISEGTWPEYERLCDLLDTKVTLYEIKPVWNQLVENLQWYNNSKTNFL